MLGYRGWPTSLKEGLDLPHLFRVPTHPLENPAGQHPLSIESQVLFLCSQGLWLLALLHGKPIIYTPLHIDDRATLKPRVGLMH